MLGVINKLLKYFKSPVKALNDAGERIESMRFSVPALRVGVLEYGPGQLQTGNAALEGKPVKLYYPSEAVSDEKFLKSLETAPVVVGGHDSTTNEQNKKIDGWAHNVFFDAAANAAMIAGVVKGAKEVAYIKGNLGSEGFGASAFVDIYNLTVENGVTPDGQEYNAVANDLRATHVALAPHVRDPENKIKVINAVCVNMEGEMFVENVKINNGAFIALKNLQESFELADDVPNSQRWAGAVADISNELKTSGNVDQALTRLRDMLGRVGNYFQGEVNKTIYAIKQYSVKNSHAENADDHLKRTIDKIEHSASVKEIEDIVRVVDSVSTWTASEKAKIKSAASAAIGFLKEYKTTRNAENTIDINPVAFAAAVKNAVKAAAKNKSDEELLRIYDKANSGNDLFPDLTKFGLTKDEETRAIKLVQQRNRQGLHDVGKDRAKRIAEQKAALRGK